jgi:hypothetical protein
LHARSDLASAGTLPPPSPVSMMLKRAATRASAIALLGRGENWAASSSRCSRIVSKRGWRRSTWCLAPIARWRALSSLLPTIASICGYPCRTIEKQLHGSPLGREALQQH